MTKPSDTLILAYLTKEERANVSPEEYHKMLADHDLREDCPVCKNWSQADHDIEYDHECVKPKEDSPMNLKTDCVRVN